MIVKLIKSPTQEQLNECKQAALRTIGKTMVNEPSDEWLRKIVDARHSPARRLQLRFYLEDKYWVLNELRTHYVGCELMDFEMFMQSSRNDRQADFDRNEAPQGMERTAEFDCNIESLINIARKRLCMSASPECRKLVQAMCAETVKALPWTNGLFVPDCDYRGGICHEMKCCGRRQHVGGM